MDSSDSYNGDDARHFLRGWRAAQDRYSEATRENSQLEIHLGASQAALLAAEEEASAAWARLAESDAMVAGKMICKKKLHSHSLCFRSDNLFIPVIPSPDGPVGEPLTGGERGYCSR